MITQKKITCENSRGEKISFGYFLPLWLKDATGLTSAAYEVSTQRQDGMDGESWQSSCAQKRNIVITAAIKGEYAAQRERLFGFFQPRERGTLTYWEQGGREKVIDYQVESVEFALQGKTRDVSISLICPYPLFRAPERSVVNMAYWEPLVRFPFVYGAPIMTARRIAERIVEVQNDQNVACDLTITFVARGPVKDPSLAELGSGGKLALALEMAEGDTVVVTTGRGQKRTLLNGISHPEIWPLANDWIQLYPGKNTYQYGAKQGVEHLDVKLEYTLEYWGA
ncbi:phage tail family protein [Acetanaerobacterium sp. MSJ-12]|uniref:phage distal tail protein n=1 Tax=Acetanaerobacterium sp. MSJ-12 TaxID=2841535 RepID=UPI001C0F015E|nr:phage tail domain-containing protein [Acetanaerobacterium sp. MSJ-12]MBU5418739.1 phage tail family protein [Acetanaerobacterium sp. MSJ-12]